MLFLLLLLETVALPGVCLLRDRSTALLLRLPRLLPALTVDLLRELVVGCTADLVFRLLFCVEVLTAGLLCCPTREVDVRVLVLLFGEMVRTASVLRPRFTADVLVLPDAVVFRCTPCRVLTAPDLLLFRSAETAERLLLVLIFLLEAVRV